MLATFEKKNNKVIASYYNRYDVLLYQHTFPNSIRFFPLIGVMSVVQTFMDKHYWKKEKTNAS